MTEDRGRTKTAGHGVERNRTLHPRGTVTSGRPWVFDRLLLQTPASPVLQAWGLGREQKQPSGTFFCQPVRPVARCRDRMQRGSWSPAPETQ